MDSVARDGGIDDGGPVVDAPGQGLGVLKSLLPEPHGDVQRTGAVMADNDDCLIRVELLVSAGRDFAHGHEASAREGGSGGLPGFTNIEQKGRVLLSQLLGQGIDRDLGRDGHALRVTRVGEFGRPPATAGFFPCGITV